MTDADGVAVGVPTGEPDTGTEPPPGNVYDRWSRHPRAMDLLYAVAFLGRGRTFRRRSLAALGLDAGSAALSSLVYALTPGGS